MQLDYLGNHADNYKLINMIQAWWRKRGYPNVRAWVEKSTNPGNGTIIYVVRTNIEQNVSTINPRHTVI